MKYALRSLLQRPASTAVVVVTLALGLGANAAIFGMIDALVIRPFPFADADRILLISETNRDGTDDRQETTSPANFLDWRRQADAVQHPTAFKWWDVNVVGRDEPERVQGFEVSAGFFDALGVQPAVRASASSPTTKSWGGTASWSSATGCGAAVSVPIPRSSDSACSSTASRTEVVGDCAAAVRFSDGGRALGAARLRCHGGRRAATRGI